MVKQNLSIRHVCKSYAYNEKINIKKKYFICKSFLKKIGTESWELQKFKGFCCILAKLFQYAFCGSMNNQK